MSIQILVSLLCAAATTVLASDLLLKNGDFESPPRNVSPTATNPYFLLTQSNPIPAWTFNGTVQYVTSGPNVSLPGDGHAIQLGLDGSINQTFIADGAYMYVLTFTLAPGGENCSTASALAVSTPGDTAQFYLEQRYGKEAWESHARGFMNWVRKGVPVNLELKSQPTEADPNITCGPVIDTLLLKGVDPPRVYSGNELINGDLEIGPEFLINSTEGILLDAVTDTAQSALQGWTVMGTVKYIDSNHYKVPQGKAAIEIVSGSLGGIQQTLVLQKGWTYNLSFVMGDANDTCMGDFILGVQAGSTSNNFTMQSNGTGSTQSFSMKFKADHSEPTAISFISYTDSQSRDLEFCGPVIDNVVLGASYGTRLEVYSGILYSCIVFLVMVLSKTM
ncbi:hypothetical protein AMTRI_Chr06g194370 [Amborella trichopoda]